MRHSLFTGLILPLFVTALLILSVGCNSQSTKKAADKSPKRTADNASSRAVDAIEKKAKRVPRLEREKKGIAAEVTYPDYTWNHEEYMKAWREKLIKSAEYLAIEHDLDESRTAQAADLIRRIIENDDRRAKASSSQANFKFWTELEQEFQAFQRQLPADPICQWMESIVWYKLGKFESAQARMKEHFELFAQYNYPKYYRVHAELHYYRIESAKMYPAMSKLKTDFGATMVDWLQTDCDLKPMEHRFVSEILSLFHGRQNSFQSTALDKVLTKLTETRPMPPWLRYMFQGRLFSRRAWAKRGGGYAYTVTSEGFAEFEEGQKLAFGFFAKALETNPRFPEPAVELIEIARTIDIGSTQRDWFDKAREIQFDFRPAYIDYRFGCLPRWGGSTKKLVDLAMECYKSEKFDTIAPYMFYEILSFAEAEASDFESEQAQKVFYSEAVREARYDCAKKMLEQYKGNAVSRNLLATHAFAGALVSNKIREACELRKNFTYDQFDRETATRMLNLSFWKLHWDLPFAMEEDADNCSIVLQATGAESPNEYDEAISICRQKLKSELSQNVSNYYSIAETILRYQQSYYAGEKIKIKFREDLALWVSSNAIANVLDANTVEIDTRTGDCNPTLHNVLNLTGPKRIEFRVQHTSANEQGESEMWGVRAGFFNNKQFRIAWNGKNEALSFAKWEINPPVYHQLGFRKTDTVNALIRIDIFDKYFEVFVNDCFILRSGLESLEVTTHLAFAKLGSPKDGRSVVRFSDLQIQRLEYKPPEQLSDVVELISYYDNRAKVTPSDPWPITCRGLLHHQQGNYEDAIADLQKGIEMGGDVGEAAAFIGNSFDRLGKTEEAIKWYLKSSEEGRLIFNAPNYLSSKSGLRFSAGVRFAETVLDWLYYSRPDLFENIDYEPKNFLNPKNYAEELWWADCIHAQKLASEGDFEKAIEFCKKNRKWIPAEFIGDYEKQLRAYRKRQMYIASSKSDFHRKAIKLPFQHPVAEQMMDRITVNMWYR